MLKVVELFAGVGGFRIGLEKAGHKVVWSNQWEPSTKTQHASMVYEARFGSDNHSNMDIAEVPTSEIPDHDVLCGGFPCQDYSVATTLRNSKGLIGKKGVLWWSIHRILSEKEKKPKFLVFENVDRLLKSPSNQRGRDFAVILQSLNELGYAVEWRVINSADYGFPQRRKRIFFIGYLKGSTAYESLSNGHQIKWLTENGLMASRFPVKGIPASSIADFPLEGSLTDISNSFNKGAKLSPFKNSGLMVDSHIYTAETTAEFSGHKQTLGEILIDDKDVSSEFFISEKDIQTWEYLKGSKSIERTSRDGHTYLFTEGRMTFPDALDKASRTIITGEGGPSPSRFKHAIQTKNGLRRLTPIELERLCGFPDNHTSLAGISDAKRAFFMGNALIVGVVEAIGGHLK